METSRTATIENINPDSSWIAGDDIKVIFFNLLKSLEWGVVNMIPGDYRNFAFRYKPKETAFKGLPKPEAYSREVPIAVSIFMEDNRLPNVKRSVVFHLETRGFHGKAVLTVYANYPGTWALGKDRNWVIGDGVLMANNTTVATWAAKAENSNPDGFRNFYWKMVGEMRWSNFDDINARALPTHKGALMAALKQHFNRTLNDKRSAAVTGWWNRISVLVSEGKDFHIAKLEPLTKKDTVVFEQLAIASQYEQFGQYDWWTSDDDDVFMSGLYHLIERMYLL